LIKRSRDRETVKHFDAMVVGCGAMGSSASYSLASKGMKVLTLERFSLNHQFGSSHGGTRIIRLAYAEDPRYVPLLRRAFSGWEELQTKSGRSLMKMTGGLMIGRSEGDLVRGVLSSAKGYALPHRLLSGSEVNEEFLAFRIGEDFSAVHEQSAGILFPEECVGAFVDAASQAGCEFRFSERVSGWTRTTDGIVVSTDKDQYLADRLVVCAGAWTGALIQGLIPLVCERQVPLWFDSKRDPRFGAGRMPIFVSEEGPGRLFYGIPDVGHGVKVAVHHRGTIVKPDSVQREVTERDVSPVGEFISSRMPGLDPNPIASTTCLYTNTPDSNFVVDFHPDDGRVVIVSACSGHGFKFAGVIGEIAADLLTAGKTQCDVSFLGIGRFAKH